MNISEAMAAIAEEAERQGFLVRQSRSGAWQIRRNGDNWFFQVSTVDGLLDALKVLIAAGLDWSETD